MHNGSNLPSTNTQFFPHSSNNTSTSGHERRPHIEVEATDYSTVDEEEDGADPLGQNVRVLVRIRPFLELDNEVEGRKRQITASSGVMRVHNDQNRIRLDLDMRNKESKFF